VRHCAAIDRMVKGMEPGSVWDELVQLGLAIAGTELLSAALL